jgi:CheY-like chemotaxis protein
MENSSVLILVVEDEALLQTLLKDILVDAGFAVIQAFDGDEAIKMLDADTAQCRCLITDINLHSKINGWDVARHARQVYRDLPVIYTTTASAHEWTSMGVPNSVLLTKPYVPAQVVTAVAQLLNAQPPHTEG